MELLAAVRALGALAQDSRLQVFRLLVRAAPLGLAAGEIAEGVGLPKSTLSFHLQHLTQAGLVHGERRGRSQIYSLVAEALQELFWFLGEDCCQGRLDLCPSPTGRIEARRIEARSEETLPGTRPAVLFLCNRNSARSQMAEALLRREAGDRFDIYSGGLRPRAIHPLTLRVLDEIGLDTSALHAKDLGQFLGKVSIHYAIIVCEATNADCPKLHPFAMRQLYWPFPDPVAALGTEEERIEVFRRVRDDMAGRIGHWLRDEMPHPDVTSLAGGDA